MQVSWVRHRDVHILTAGEQSFTSDARFSARHNTEDEWVLLIKFVQERDAGIYECQIPTQPPQSYPITLNIIGTGRGGSILGLASPWPPLQCPMCGYKATPTSTSTEAPPST